MINPCHLTKEHLPLCIEASLECSDCKVIFHHITKEGYTYIEAFDYDYTINCVQCHNIVLHYNQTHFRDKNKPKQIVDCSYEFCQNFIKEAFIEWKTNPCFDINDNEKVSDPINKPNSCFNINDIEQVSDPINKELSESTNKENVDKSSDEIRIKCNLAKNHFDNLAGQCFIYNCSTCNILDNHTNYCQDCLNYLVIEKCVLCLEHSPNSCSKDICKSCNKIIQHITKCQKKYCERIYVGFSKSEEMNKILAYPKIIDEFPIQPIVDEIQSQIIKERASHINTKQTLRKIYYNIENLVNNYEEDRIMDFMFDLGKQMQKLYDLIEHLEQEQEQYDSN